MERFQNFACIPKPSRIAGRSISGNGFAALEALCALIAVIDTE